MVLQFEPRIVSYVYDLLFSQESPENPDGQKHMSSLGSLGSAPHTPLFSQGGSQILSKLHRNKTKFVSVLYILYFCFDLFTEKYLPSSQKSPSYSGVQVQVTLKNSSKVHVPPFKQGFLESPHGSAS